MEAEVTKEIAKYVDEAMFKAEEIDPEKGPEVWLLQCNNDPLGSIAAAAKAYKGEFVAGLWEITDEERRYYLEQIQLTKLAMPLESVNFHFRFSGVTRGFTHQLVRQRVAAYSQESTRFAVKESVPVGLPPSLLGTDQDEWKRNYQEYNDMHAQEEYSNSDAQDYAFKYTSKPNRWRHKWEELMAFVELTYNELVDDGMPAEDARGALPTNLLTQVNYFTDLRALKDHSGNRLCTQAQFEWKQVWSLIVQRIEEYGQNQTYLRPFVGTGPTEQADSLWQFQALASIFRPVCYYTGKCEFGAEFDRKCSIRERVQANHAIGRPSVEWGQPYDPYLSGGTAPVVERTELGIPTFIGPIRTEEWLLDSAAAR